MLSGHWIAQDYNMKIPNGSKPSAIVLRVSRVRRMRDDALPLRALREVEHDAARRDRLREPLVVDPEDVARGKRLLDRGVDQAFEGGIIAPHHERVGIGVHALDADQRVIAG